MRTRDEVHQVCDGVCHATWSNPSSPASEILITPGKIIRKIYTLMTAFRWVATTRESSSLLTCWLSIITISNKEFANLDQIFILEMNLWGVIFYHYLDVMLDLFDLVLKILIIKIIWVSLCEMVFPRTEIIDNFICNSKKWKSHIMQSRPEREKTSRSRSDRNEPFILLNTTEWDYVILWDHN